MIRLPLKLHITAVLLTICMLGSAQGAENDSFRYRLQVRVEPALHRLDAEAWIQHPPDSRLYLHKGLAVREAVPRKHPRERGRAFHLQATALIDSGH